MNYKVLQNNPFDRFVGGKFESKIQSWTKPFDEKVFTEVIEKVRPRLIIELGSFLGYSTIHMLKACKAIGLDTKVICVDTWLGGADHWINHERGTDSLFFEYHELSKGISSVFDQFCINMVNEGLHDRVIPIPNTTDNAFVFLKEMGTSAGLVYIDASHLSDQVKRDIQNYSKLLEPDGYLFGHDINWESVKAPLEEFCEDNKLTYDVFEDKYWLVSMKSFSFETLGLKSPYAYYKKNKTSVARKLWSWEYPDAPAFFGDLVNSTNPSLTCEVGSFLGHSAILMAKTCKAVGLSPKIVCVDTWLGSAEHWNPVECNLLPSEFDSFEFGISSLYDKFIWNVIDEECEDFIIPLPNTSRTAAKILSNCGAEFDLVYIDGDHTEESVYEDLTSYFKLLREGGRIFCDDYKSWAPVKTAFDRFAEENKRVPLMSAQGNLACILK